MKKIILSTILSALLLLPAFSFEWGGLFTENAKGTIGDLSYFDTISIRQSNSVALWATVPFDKTSKWYMAVQGSYKYNLDYAIIGKKWTNIVDIDLLKLSGALSVGDNTINLSAGRFFIADSTSKIFAQNCDGVMLNYNTLFTRVTAYAGYTGLLNGYNIYMLDNNGVIDEKNNVLLKVYRQSASYVPVIASVTFPSLFLNQSVGAQFMAIFDMNSSSDSKANRYYGSVTMEGPISGPVFYAFNTTFSSKDFKNVSNYSSLKFSIYKKPFAVKVGAEYASGKQLFLDPFVGFTSQPAVNSYASPEYSGLLLPGVDFIVSLKQLSVYFNGKGVFACPDEEFSFEGVDGSIKCYFNIFSDLRLDLGASVYYDFKDSGTNNLYSANLGLTLSF